MLRISFIICVADITIYFINCVADTKLFTFHFSLFTFHISLFSFFAVVAQLVEHRLPKPRVAGSSPVYRSKEYLVENELSIIMYRDKKCRRTVVLLHFFC